MTDLEINKALALAVGWLPGDIIEYPGQDYIGLPVLINGRAIKLFSYRFPVVIWPIAERYNVFPASEFHAGKLPRRWWAFGRDMRLHFADTAAKAVALAVIGASK